MFLSAPTVATWTISSLLVLALIAVKYLGIALPVVGPVIGGNLFEVLLAAYAILWAGNVFRGL